MIATMTITIVAHAGAEATRNIHVLQHETTAKMTVVVEMITLIAMTGATTGEVTGATTVGMIVAMTGGTTGGTTGVMTGETIGGTIDGTTEGMTAGSAPEVAGVTIVTMMIIATTEETETDETRQKR